MSRPHLGPTSGSSLEAALRAVEQLGGVLHRLSESPWLSDQDRVEAVFRLQFPHGGPTRLLAWPSARLRSKWIGPRWIAVPPELPTRPLATVGSSRLGRRWGHRAKWFTLLRQTVALHRDSVVWLAGRQTAAGDWLQHVAGRVGADCRLVEPPGERGSRRDQWRRWWRSVGADPPATSWQLSPLVGQRPQTLLAGRLTDRATWGLAERVFCLGRRQGGAIEQLAEEYQREFGSGLTVIDGFGQWAWPSWDSGTDSGCRPRIVNELPWPALGHWVRGSSGNWPGEEEALWRDRLVLTAAGADGLPFSTLRHIVQQGRLCATSRLLPTSTPMVCFTEQPPTLWSEQRVFRPHLGRWDFEPYGIVVARDALSLLGARPVTYVSPDEFPHRGRADRALIQPRTSDSGIDWSVEREWRLPGDLDLSQLPADQWGIVVAKRAEAWALAGQCRAGFFFVASAPSSR